MSKISFKTWLETEFSTSQKTYIPNGTANNGNAETDVAGNNANNFVPIDPDIAQAAQGLEAIYGQLQQIFMKVREREKSFKYPQMKASFDKQLISGIDGVGRAHAIILPTAQGIKHLEK